MAGTKAGDTVKVHYTGKLEDGTVFDSSRQREPLEFTLDGSSVIPGFEQAIIGMNPGESKTVSIPATEAYGPHHQEMLLKVKPDQLGPDTKPQVGQQLKVHRGDDESFVVKVTEISEESVTLDANHPLAGMDLVFELELVEICS